MPGPAPLSLRCLAAARRALVLAAPLLALANTACGGGGGVTPLPEAQVRDAVARLDGLAADLMRRSGIPGMAVAVVRGDEVLYAKGFGVRRAGAPEAVNADTVFALASMSKPLGATVVARQVTLGTVGWETPLREVFPWFTLADPAASARVTVGDLYAHRSGLPDHAGDTLEELGFDRDTILRRLHQLPLAPFREKFDYTNYGMTAAATAVAARAGTDWATLAERTLYQPLGMASTSSRFADFLVRPNRAPGHVVEGGAFVLGAERPAGTGEHRWSQAWDTDRQSPTGGVSSSANDMARWMSFVLGGINGTGQAPRLLSPEALMPAVRPQVRIGGSSALSVHYGFGFFVDVPLAGRTVLRHNGAYAWGTGTNFSLLPSANLGIVVLTNAWPTGVAEALSAQFLDLAQFGTLTTDWYAYHSGELAGAYAPQGELVNRKQPSPAVPARALAEYAGTYESPYHGQAQVVPTAQGLELRMGAQGQAAFALSHWSGDLFHFVPFNDGAQAGSRSKADFTGGRLVLEYYSNPQFGLAGLGTFTRVPAGGPSH